MKAIDSVTIKECIHTRPPKQGQVQVICDLKGEPCVMYQGDSLNGEICPNYEGDEPDSLFPKDTKGIVIDAAYGFTERHKKAIKNLLGEE